MEKPPSTWQRPTRTCKPEKVLDSRSIIQPNRFTPLCIEDEAEEEEDDEVVVEREIPRPTTPRKGQKKFRSKKQTEEANEFPPQVQPITHRPYKPSYFLQGRIEGRPLSYLLDTGCNTNLLSKKMFDSLPERIRNSATRCDEHGILADGRRMPFYGNVTLHGQVGGVRFQEAFAIGVINEDAILGMAFLVSHQCSIDFSTSEVKIGERRVPCSDKHGHRMVTKVQARRDIVLQPFSETNVVGRVTTRNYPELGMVEGTDKEILLAASINRPGIDGRIVLRCLNVSDRPIAVKAGQVLGTYQGIEDTDVCSERTDEAVSIRPGTSRGRPSVPSHVEDLYERAGRGQLTPEQRKSLADLLSEYEDVFSKDDLDIGQTQLVQHSIPTLEGARPLRQPPHRLGPAKEAEAERQVKKLLEQGMIEPSTGAWSSPVVLVRKKDQSWRFCIDYRRLNAVTASDAYPLPRIDESLDALSGAKFFSTLDLTSGYWQVPLDNDAREKSAFITRSGLWQWKVLPFGLTSAPATFQRLMERVLHGLHWKTLLLYLDDVIVIAPDFESHLERLEEVLGRLRQANLKLKPKKCELIQREVKYLGHVVSAAGVATDPDKIEAIRQWRPPCDLKGVQAFLGTAGYYRQFIPDYATIAKPLTQLTQKNAGWSWGVREEEAFQALRHSLMTAPILGYPDPTSPYFLDTDASAVGVGAVLSQIQEGKERVVAYYSKTLSPAERNYCVTRRELLAVIKAVKHFRPYLYGQKFTLRTDHASLRWLCRRREPSAQVARWLEILAEFQMTLEHRAGPKHGNADGLSRQTCLDCKQCQRVEERDGGPTHAQLLEDDRFALPKATGHVSRILTYRDLDTKELIADQRSEDHAVGRIYQMVKENGDLSSEELHHGDYELKRLYKCKDALRIRLDGVLEVRVVMQDRPHWAVICPPSRRHTITWDTHGMTHAGIGRTLARIRLHWYWPGMTSDIRRVVNSCEKCQAGKAGGVPKTDNRQRLHAGRPWQQVAVDLVGPFPETPRKNKWILVLTDHFTRWQDALALPDATAPTVATALDERVFCYLGLPEQIHSDQGVQFESQLMQELCSLWGVEKTRTTPYHPQSNGIVERNNRKLGDALRTLLLNRGADEWDVLLPQIMRAFRGTPNSTTGETANLLLLGRELRLPDMLQHHPPDPNLEYRTDYVVHTQGRLQEVHNLLRATQEDVRTEDTSEPPLFMRGDLVWMVNKRRRKGENPKLQRKFVGPFRVEQGYPNHTYLISRQGQTSVQNESRLKMHRACHEAIGQAPAELEPRRGPNMKGGYGKRAFLPQDRSTLEEVPAADVPPMEPDHETFDLAEAVKNAAEAIRNTVEVPKTPARLSEKETESTVVVSSKPAGRPDQLSPPVLAEESEGFPAPSEPSGQVQETEPGSQGLTRTDKSPSVTPTVEGQPGRPQRERRRPDWYGEWEGISRIRCDTGSREPQDGTTENSERKDQGEACQRLSKADWPNLGVLPQFRPSCFLPGSQPFMQTPSEGVHVPEERKTKSFYLSDYIRHPTKMSGDRNEQPERWEQAVIAEGRNTSSHEINSDEVGAHGQPLLENSDFVNKLINEEPLLTFGEDLTFLDALLDSDLALPPNKSPCAFEVSSETVLTDVNTCGKSRLSTVHGPPMSKLTPTPYVSFKGRTMPTQSEHSNMEKSSTRRREAADTCIRQLEGPYRSAGSTSRSTSLVPRSTANQAAPIGRCEPLDDRAFSSTSDSTGRATVSLAPGETGCSLSGHRPQQGRPASDRYSGASTVATRLGRTADIIRAVRVGTLAEVRVDQANTVTVEGDQGGPLQVDPPVVHLKPQPDPPRLKQETKLSLNEYRQRRKAAADDNNSISGAEQPELRVRLVRVAETERAEWVEPETRREMERADGGGRCLICDWQREKKRTRIHIRHHFVRFYCTCGYATPSRDTLRKHHRLVGRETGHGDGRVYMADNANYHALGHYLGWHRPPPCRPCEPVLCGEQQLSEENRLRVAIPRRQPPAKVDAPRHRSHTQKRKAEEPAAVLGRPQADLEEGEITEVMELHDAASEDVICPPTTSRGTQTDAPLIQAGSRPRREERRRAVIRNLRLALREYDREF